MHVALTIEASNFVARLVASGEFATPDEAVAEALDLLRRNRELDTALAAGVRDFEEGRFRDGEEVFTDLKRIAEERVARDAR